MDVKLSKLKFPCLALEDVVQLILFSFSYFSVNIVQQWCVVWRITCCTLAYYITLIFVSWTGILLHHLYMNGSIILVAKPRMNKVNEWFDLHSFWEVTSSAGMKPTSRRRGCIPVFVQQLWISINSNSVICDWETITFCVLSIAPHCVEHCSENVQRTSTFNLIAEACEIVLT